jgi:hypothetical protein
VATYASPAGLLDIYYTPIFGAFCEKLTQFFPRQRLRAIWIRSGGEPVFGCRARGERVFGCRVYDLDSVLERQKSVQRESFGPTLKRSTTAKVVLNGHIIIDKAARLKWWPESTVI